jgi:hypothetical protein
LDKDKSSNDLRTLARANQTLQAEVTARERIETELVARVGQQAVVAQIGQLALSGADVSVLLQEACALVARNLGVEFCKVLELLPNGEALRLRAGFGWKEGLVGEATVNVGLQSQAGYTLHCGKPVLVEICGPRPGSAGRPCFEITGSYVA